MIFAISHKPLKLRQHVKHCEKDFWWGFFCDVICVVKLRKKRFCCSWKKQ